MADDLYDELIEQIYEDARNEVNYQTAKANFWATIEGDPNGSAHVRSNRYVRSMGNNVFNHHWARRHKRTADIHVMPSRKPEPKPYKPRTKPTAEQERDRRKADANLLGLSLMNWFLPDGETRLKDATGKQVRELGGWFMLIAKHVRPNEIVGVKLTAEQLFNLHEQHFAKAA